MWKQFNFKFDKRTAKNIAVTPFIIFIRVPIVLLYWGMEWSVKHLEVIAGKLPGWDS